MEIYYFEKYIAFHTWNVTEFDGKRLENDRIS